MLNLYNNPIRGIITPLLTPLKEDGSIDYVATERLVRYVIEGEVAGIFVLGTTGEGPCIDFVDKCEFVSKVIQLVAGRVPVLVGITDTVYANSVRLISLSGENGAAGVVITPPPYFSCSQSELLVYFEALSSRSELPCYLYNIPSLTKTTIEPETVALASVYSKIIGLKDSSGDMIYLNKVRELVGKTPEFALYIGPEELLAETVIFGIHGGVHGGSNIFPRLYVELYRAAEMGQLKRVKELHRIVISISSKLYSLSGYENHCIRVVKYLLSLFGICDHSLAKPYLGLNAESMRVARERVEEVLTQLTDAGIPVPSLSVGQKQ